MEKVMEVRCKEKWQSCKACNFACSGFQKILDLKDAGLIIYRHTKRIDEINKSTGNLESSIKTTDDVFIIHNTKNIKINADDCIKEIGDEVSCPRCRELVQRAQKYLKNISIIDKKDVISVCDHCQAIQKSNRSIKYCCECQDVVKTFLLEREKQSVEKGQLKAWLSKIQKLLSKTMVTNKKTRLKYATHYELYLNKLYKDDVSSVRSLEVGPMLDVGVRIKESAGLIDKGATKSESALKSLDSKRTKFKSTLTENGSFVEIKRHASSSLANYDTNIIKDDQDPNSFERFRNKRQRDEEFEQQTTMKHHVSPRTLKKYYSDEKMFFSLAGLEDLEIKKTNFNYVFPKEETEAIKSLRRVKTSAELIEDTRDRLRVRAKLVNDEINRQLTKRSKLPSSQKEAVKKNDKERPSSKKTTILEKDIKSDKDKKQKDIKDNKEELEKDKKKKEKEKNEEMQKNLRLREKKKAKDEKLVNKVEKPQNKGDSATDNLKKMMEEQAKLKAEALKIKKQQEEENKRLRMEAERKLKSLNETKAEKKPQTPKPEQEEPTNKDLNVKQFEIRKPSTDDLILQLVKVRQVQKQRPKRLSEMNVTPLMVKRHNIHRGKIRNCVICEDSEMELDVENIMYAKNKIDEVNELIVGNEIIKSKLPLSDIPAMEENIPVLYKSLFTEDIESKQQNEMAEKMTEEKNHKPPTLLSHKHTEQEHPIGIIRYALSDRSFIDKGWTMLPTEKVVRKMNVYRMRPAHPEFDWFGRNKNKRLMQYDTGEKLAEFDDNGRGRWFYRNGRLALDYYNAEEMNAQQRIVIYGSGERDERGRHQPISILATFDYLGNGVVFDHTGKIRLKYNQTEGVVLDRSIGPVSHWKWHSLNDPPVLQQVMIDTQMSHKDPDILKLGDKVQTDDKVRHDNEEMLAIEFDNFIKEKSKKMSQKFKPFQIRTKAMKINENFSLKVLDQANIYLIFRAGTTHIKMNIGMILDHQEIVDTDTAEVGEVTNNLERFPARTDSLAGLQRSVAYAQRIERLRVERERRLKHPEQTLSADRMVAATSRPLRAQLNIVPSNSSETKDECYYKCRKPLTSNLYYDTRLVQ